LLGSVIKDWSRPAGSFANAESWGAKTVSDGAELRVVTMPATVAAVTTVFSCGTVAAAAPTGRAAAAVSRAGVTPNAVHPGPHGRLVFVVAELLAADELAVEVVAAADADDVVLDDDEESELHAESAAAAAASNPTDTAIPRRMITADSFRVWSFEGSYNPGHSRHSTATAQ
jgi:hypothetical protein